MKLQFLGTAAAEGAPAIFCECAHCRYAREKGGREIRTRSGSLIDDRLKLDFGPDSYKQLLDNRLNFSPIISVLMTHSHEDHLSVGDLACRRRVFAHLPEGVPPMTVYGNERVGTMIAPILSDRIAFQRMIPFETVRVEDFAVTALEAVHCLSGDDATGFFVTREGKRYARSEEALFYLIEKNGQSILYAHDTDRFTPADMEFLTGRHIDLISLDCTNGYLDIDYIGHMGAKDNLLMRDRLTAIGAADDHTVFVANHFSHNGLKSHEEMEALIPGFIIAYDGLTVEI